MRFGCVCYSYRLFLSQPTKHVTADKRIIARLTVTAFNLQSFIKPLSHGTTTPLKQTLDSQKPTSKQDTEITSHHSATPSTKTHSKDSSQIECLIWFLHQRAVSNYRQYCFGLLGLISAVLILRWISIYIYRKLKELNTGQLLGKTVIALSRIWTHVPLITSRVWWPQHYQNIQAGILMCGILRGTP